MLTDSSPSSKIGDIELMLVNAIAEEHKLRQKERDRRVTEWLRSLQTPLYYNPTQLLTSYKQKLKDLF
jgi:hypothetical protein